MSAHPQYPVVRFLARHGVLVSWLSGGICLAAGLIALICGAPIWVGLAALIAAAIAVAFVRSYAELVQIISETLLPR